MNKETVYNRVALRELSELTHLIATKMSQVVDSPQEALIELRVAIEELYKVARSTKTECRSKLGRSFIELSAEAFCGGISLLASDEWDALREKERDKPIEEPLIPQKGNNGGKQKKGPRSKKNSMATMAI